MIQTLEITDPSAKKAFEKTRDTSEQVRRFLDTLKDADVSTSRITMNESRNWQTQKILGYRAIISYRVILKNLEDVERVVTGLIDSGANSIQSVEFQCSNLKSLRAKARQLAIQAAQEKARIYCDAANADIGHVLHIEDVNPDSIEAANRPRGGHYQGLETAIDESEEVAAINPGDIRIAGAVRASFEIRPRGT